MPFTKEFYETTWINGYAFAKLIIPALNDFCSIGSVLEMGCGAGGFLKFCTENEKNIKGIEINEKALKSLVIPYESVFSLDISKPLDIELFDVVVSLEVIEHIDSAYEDTVIDNIVNSSNKYIIFSGARVGQPGDGHINCRNQDYWIEKFTKRTGVYLMQGLSRLLRGNVDIPTYYRENTLIFEKIF